MSIIIATSRTYPAGNADLQELAKLLNAALCPWQDISPSEQKDKTILPLAVWDYSDDAARYLAWLEALQAAGARIINSADLQRWNIDKRYLTALADLHLPITPSIALLPNEAADWAAKIAACPWENPVVKPLIGQSGKGVSRLHDSPSFCLADYPNGVLLQPFITADFERCFIFFEGQFSHAIDRVGDDWRKNSVYGAKPQPVDLADRQEAVMDWAQPVFHALPERPVYARIDVLSNDNQWFINEIELIEPALYHTDSSRRDFAARLLRS